MAASPYGACGVWLMVDGSDQSDSDPLPHHPITPLPQSLSGNFDFHFLAHLRGAIDAIYNPGDHGALLAGNIDFGVVLDSIDKRLDLGMMGLYVRKMNRADVQKR